MNKIFKFYKYQSLSEAKHFNFLQNYLNQKVWLNPLEKLNDPFEGRCSFISPSPDFILNSPHVFNGLLEQHHLNGEPGLTENEFKARLNSENFRNSLIESSKILEFKKHGALCLTTKNNDIPMWAYYADNHKGYCIEFELDFLYLCEKAEMNLNYINKFINMIMQGSDIFSRNLYKNQQVQAFVFTKIRYSKEVPSFFFEDYFKLSSHYEQLKYIVQNSVAVKSIEWKHEDEFRLIVNGNSEDSKLLPLEKILPFLKVTGIIIGSQMERSKLSRVYDLCRDTDIKLYSTAYSDSLYEIIVKPFSKMDHDIIETNVAILEKHE